jgi:hypothetical protein
VRHEIISKSVGIIEVALTTTCCRILAVVAQPTVHPAEAQRYLVAWIVANFDLVGRGLCLVLDILDPFLAFLRIAMQVAFVDWRLNGEVVRVVGVEIVVGEVKVGYCESYIQKIAGLIVDFDPVATLNSAGRMCKGFLLGLNYYHQVIMQEIFPFVPVE